MIMFTVEVISELKPFCSQEDAKKKKTQKQNPPVNPPKNTNQKPQVFVSFQSTTHK